MVAGFNTQPNIEVYHFDPVLLMESMQCCVAIEIEQGQAESRRELESEENK